MLFKILGFLCLILTTQVSASDRTFCKPSNTTCWPTTAQIDALKLALGPSINRQLKWTNSS